MNRLESIVIALIALAWTGIGYAADVPADCASEPPSIHDFVGDAETLDVRVAPDGKHVAAERVSEGRRVVDIYTVPQMKLQYRFGVKGDSDVEDYYWVGNDRLVFGFAYRLGTLGTAELTGYLMAVNDDGSKPVTLLGTESNGLYTTSAEYRNFDIVDPLPDDPRHLLVSIYDDWRNGAGELPNLYLLDKFDGSKHKLMQSWERFASFQTDLNHVPRFMVGSNRDGTYVLRYRDSAEADWKEIAHYKSGHGSMSPIAFDSDNQHVYIADDIDAETEGIKRVDLHSRVQQLLFRDPIYDTSDLIPGLTPGKYVGTWTNAAAPVLNYFDPKDPDTVLIEALRQNLGGGALRIIDFSKDRRLAVVYAYSDTAPGIYYLVDLAKHQLIGKFPRHDALVGKQFSQMLPFELKARDGTSLHGYLVPPACKPVSRNSPMIVRPHGGPYGLRDHWEFDAEAQLLSSRGYTVMMLDYRGSGGYGKSFLRAGYGQWGGAMEDDLIDATRWAIEQGFADADRIGIYGGSYGGYAALMAPIRAPGLFRCVAGYAGVYDLQTLWSDSDIGAYSEGRAYLREAIGKDDKDLRERSPASHAAEIDVPVFLAHGGKDFRAPVENFKHMRDALQAAHKPVELMLKDNEGHGYYDEKNRVEFYQHLLDFFQRNLMAASKSPAATP